MCIINSPDGQEISFRCQARLAQLAERKALIHKRLKHQPSATLWSRVRAPGWALLLLFGLCSFWLSGCFVGRLNGCSAGCFCLGNLDLFALLCYYYSLPRTLYSHTHTRTHTRTHVHTHTHLHTRTHAYAYTHTYAYTRTHAHTRTNTHAQTRSHELASFLSGRAQGS